MKYTALIILLFSAFHTNAQVAMEQMTSSSQMKGLQSFQAINSSSLNFEKQYRIIKIPKEDSLNLKRNSAIEELLKNCLGCQEVPQIGGGPVTPIILKPTTTALEFCKKYPGKFGCSK